MSRNPKKPSQKKTTGPHQKEPSQRSSSAKKLRKHPIEKTRSRQISPTALKRCEEHKEAIKQFIVVRLARTFEGGVTLTTIRKRVFQHFPYALDLAKKTGYEFISDHLMLQGALPELLEAEILVEERRHTGGQVPVCFYKPNPAYEEPLRRPAKKQRLVRTADEAIKFVGNEWGTIRQLAGVLGETTEVVKGLLYRAEGKGKILLKEHKQQLPKRSQRGATRQYLIKHVWPLLVRSV